MLADSPLSALDVVQIVSPAAAVLLLHAQSQPAVALVQLGQGDSRC